MIIDMQSIRLEEAVRLVEQDMVQENGRITDISISVGGPKTFYRIRVDVSRWREEDFREYVVVHDATCFPPILESKTQTLRIAS